MGEPFKGEGGEGCLEKRASALPDAMSLARHAASLTGSRSGRGGSFFRFRGAGRFLGVAFKGEGGEGCLEKHASALADAMSLARHAASAVGAASAGEAFNENPSPFRGGTCVWENQFFQSSLRDSLGLSSATRHSPTPARPVRARRGPRFRAGLSSVVAPRLRKEILRKAIAGGYRRWS